MLNALWLLAGVIAGCGILDLVAPSELPIIFDA